MLREHSVFGYAVVPGVAYLELIVTAAERSGIERPTIDELALRAPLTLGADERIELQVVIESAADGGARAVHVHSRHDAGWRRHADAVVRAADPVEGGASEPIGPVLERCSEVLTGDEFYDQIWHPSFVLGPSFRLIDQVSRRDGEALAMLRVPRSSQAGPRPDLLALDACVQTLVATLPRDAGLTDRPLALGTGHASFRAYRTSTPERVWCWATLSDAGSDRLEGDVRVLDEHGDAVADLGGIRFRRIHGETVRRLAVPPAVAAQPRRAARSSWAHACEPRRPPSDSGCSSTT